MLQYNFVVIITLVFMCFLILCTCNVFSNRLKSWQIIDRKQARIFFSSEENSAKGDAGSPASDVKSVPRRRGQDGQSPASCSPQPHRPNSGAACSPSSKRGAASRRAPQKPLYAGSTRTQLMRAELAKVASGGRAGINRCGINRACHLVAITGTTKLVPYHLVKTLQLIRRSGTRRWNLRVPGHQMSCRELRWMRRYQDCGSRGAFH